MYSLILIVIASLVSAGCAPLQTNRVEELEVCKRMFNSGKYDLSLAKTLSIEELIEAERCGFVRHPPISFLGEIVESDDYPVPTLLLALQAADEPYWTAHLLHLLKAVMERGRFADAVRRDRELILRETRLAFNKFDPDSRVYLRALDLRDGIEMYLGQSS